MALPAAAQYVTLTGTLQGANGLPLANNTINLQPSQTFFVGGSSPLVVAPLNVQCGTSTDGSVVGIVNPPNAAVPSASYGSGTLPAGNYYTEIAWYDAAGHLTLVSPEAQKQLTGTGTLTIQPPASGMPAAAVGMKVYIAASSGAETLQGTTTGAANFVQSSPLASGAAVPATNTTICQVIANDAGWPTGTGYNVSVTGPTGALVPGYPMQWQLLGPGNTINLGTGLPLYNGQVTYPVPLLALPYNHAPQSMSGPFSLTNYNLTQVGKLGVGTTVPGWGVDVEGSSLNAYINAKGGYLVNGLAPPSGTYCLGSTDGVAWDTSIACLTASALNYQTVEAGGTALPQEPALNFISGANASVTCADNSGASRTDCTVTNTSTTGQSIILGTATTITATTPTSTGLVLPSTPATTLRRGSCRIGFHQAIGSANVAFAIGASPAPTSLWVLPPFFSDTAYPQGALGTTLTTITTTSVTTLISSIAVTYNTEYVAWFDFGISPGSSPVTVTIYGNTSSGSDALVVDPGSACGWLP